MFKSRLRGVVAIGLIGAAISSAPAAASPSKELRTNGAHPSGHCVIDRHDPAATVAALRDDCTGEQILRLFEKAPLGVAPTGTRKIALLPAFQLDGRLLPYDQARLFTRTQNKFGDSLTFTTGPTGKAWVYKNYLWGRDAGGALTSGDSRVDGKPVRTADFSADFAGEPVSVHEYRQLTPGVWIGRDIGGDDDSSGKTDKGGPTGGAFALS